MTHPRCSPASVSLLPCPFCGSKAKQSTSGAAYRVYCSNGAECTASTGYWQSEHNVMQRWNTRAALPVPDATGMREAQRSELDNASNACLELAAKHGYATGHGDTVADMIREFSAQIPDPAQAEPETYRETVRRIAAAREKRLAQFRDALESIAAWRQVNTQGEFEHGLRDIIRSITDCAAAALETSPLPSQHHHTATE